MLHVLHIRLCLTLSHALENYLRPILSPTPERKLQQKQLVQPGFGCFTSRYSSSNLTREQPMGQENDFACRSLHLVAILPKMLPSFTLQQNTPPPLPSQSTLNNRLRLGQGICSASCFPRHWERMTLPRGMVNHLSAGEKSAPG